ncbi:hypothetical protein Y1Q_0019116 [Alligator mississippiensis]|uniref:Uncharacterized protein n=1 Tax=Alligator mississippiensis TaxID=8496 RepID=A0A151MQ44_ALLMI|nr:hypothetical protein Y1Q_0019116 [Alligator mississippiensis]
MGGLCQKPPEALKAAAASSSEESKQASLQAVCWGKSGDSRRGARHQILLLKERISFLRGIDNSHFQVVTLDNGSDRWLNIQKTLKYCYRRYISFTGYMYTWN